MDLADWRDIALIIIGFIHVLIVLVVAGVAGAIWIFGGKGLRALNRLVNEKVRPILGQVELQMLAVRDRTARLPGNAALGLGEMPAQKQKKKGLPFPLPFGKKRRRFPFLPS